VRSLRLGRDNSGAPTQGAAPDCHHVLIASRTPPPHEGTASVSLHRSPAYYWEAVARNDIVRMDAHARARNQTHC